MIRNTYRLYTFHQLHRLTFASRFSCEPRVSIRDYKREEGREGNKGAEVAAAANPEGQGE